ncbi:hypothetical protein [Embleya sp. NBC_00896]|uniref:hypothetical protein n=1 Tax=Embleya sp. NBC_00896 TaxID=2975961 RepID=UPI00386D82FD|nr:hypothetical protein OG928_11715 [Embleya sp. NBC_00896]
MRDSDEALGMDDDGDAWYVARSAVMGLRDVLVAAGMEADFTFLTADVNAFGRGIVNLGRVTPATTRRLTALLRAAREALGDEAFATEGSEGENDHG